MEVLQARIDSFKKPKRVKNPNKSSSTTTVRWPHPPDFKANPETLAEAGFFYDPSYDGPDSVTCYVCDKELEGWETDDDPHAIHFKKCGQICCWAIVRCGMLKDMDKSSRFVFTDKTRLPTHKLMEKARLDTFGVGKGWIHDQVKNHGANSKMMARAGFVYTPQQSNDDLVTCLYCDTSLRGWDVNDDPMEEHRKRKEKSKISCPFFSATVSEHAPANRAISRSQSTKPPSKSQSKPPTRSTSKSRHQDILLPTKTHDGDSDNDSGSSQSATVAKVTAKTPRKGRSASGARKSTAKTPKSKTRSSSKSSLKNVAEVDEDDEDALLITVKKKARSRSKSVARSEPEQSNAEGDVQKKTLRSKSKARVEDSEDVPKKPSRSKVKPSEDDEVPTKPSRTRSKIKVLESEEEEEPVTAVKHRLTSRTTSRSKSKAPPEPLDESEPEAATVTPKKAPVELKHHSQTPADRFGDDAVIEDYVPPPSSPARDLTPLFIPKRNTVATTLTHPEEEDKPPPEEKERKKHGRPKKEISVEESVEDKPPKEKYRSQPVVKQKMKVVEISSDEEPEETEPEMLVRSDKRNTHGSTTAQATSQSRNPKRSLTVEVIKPGLPFVATVSPIRDVDVVMGDIEPEAVYPAPSTPLPRTPPEKDIAPPPKMAPTSTTVETPLIPTLSKLPFTPWHALTEAELDMTVEEWIRYQIDVEYDKFRRDGERELQRFRNQAEEVRKAIEGL